MKINSTYYRQDGNCRTSLLLQQVYDTKKEKGILLACVVTQSAGGSNGANRAGGGIPLCDRLLDTFRQDILPRSTDNMENCCAYIKAALEKPPGDSLSYSGVFLNGDEILLFGYGSHRIYLLNSAFMRPHLELLSGNITSEEQFFKIYKIEPGAAVIAATEPFYELLDEEMLKECMYINDDNTGVKAGKHIKEYGRYMEAAGGQEMGAVVVKLVEEKIYGGEEWDY